MSAPKAKTEPNPQPQAAPAAPAAPTPPMVTLNVWMRPYGPELFIMRNDGPKPRYLRYRGTNKAATVDSLLTGISVLAQQGKWTEEPQ